MRVDNEGLRYTAEFPNPQMADLVTLPEARTKLARALMYPSSVRFTEDGDREKFSPVRFVLGERLTTNEIKTLAEGIQEYSCTPLYMERVYPGGQRVATGQPIGYIYLIHLAERLSGVPMITSESPD